MSEWIVCKDKTHISVSEDKEAVEVLLEQNNFGNVYLEIPIDFLVEVLGDFLRADAKS